MKLSFKRLWLVETAALAVILFTLTGCGQNLFKGLIVPPSVTDTSELVKSGNYDAAIVQANKVLENPNSSAVEKQVAYQDKGISILAQNNITIGKMATLGNSLVENIDTQTPLTVDVTELAPISISDAIESADALNAADELSTPASSYSTMDISDPLSIALNKSFQLTRGIANLTVVIKMTSRVYDYSDLSNIVLQEDVTLGESITYLFSSSNRNVYYYFAQARDAFAMAGNVLSASQLEKFDHAVVVAYNGRRLYEAYSTNSIFTMQTIDGNPLVYYQTPTAFYGTDEQKEPMLKEALEQLYNYAKQ